MIELERAAEIATAFDAIGPVPEDAGNPLADFERWQKYLADFFSVPEQQRWYEERYGPYLPLGDSSPSSIKTDKQTPMMEHHAAQIAGRLRQLPRSLFRALLGELAPDFGRAVAEESEEQPWQA